MDTITYHYNNNIIWVPRFQMDGGRASIYGGPFGDENFNLTHGPGVLSMASYTRYQMLGLISIRYRCDTFALDLYLINWTYLYWSIYKCIQISIVMTETNRKQHKSCNKLHTLGNNSLDQINTDQLHD